ncbi:MAG: HTH domain-containing protein [Proteobacteria bacterium]|nr:HTH domain-containing protein [Pseudomonadota bacterium]
MITINKSELVELYKTMSNKELADKLGVSIVTLIKTLKASGIELKGKGGGLAGQSKIQVVD